MGEVLGSLIYRRRQDICRQKYNHFRKNDRTYMNCGEPQRGDLSVKLGNLR